MFHRRDKPIAAARQGFDEARSLGRVAEDFADLVDGGIQVVIDVDKGVGPEALLQFLAREDISGTPQQDGQKLKGLAAKFQLHSGLAQLAGAQVDFVVGEPQESKLGLNVRHWWGPSWPPKPCKSDPTTEPCWRIVNVGELPQKGVPQGLKPALIPGTLGCQG
jgi:hypothetical protein